MNAMRHELPIAIRRLARAPGFSFAVVSFLGISIAALLAVAAAAYGLMLRPLPYPDAKRLVGISGQSRAMDFSLGLSAPLIAELEETYAHLASFGGWERRREEEGLEPTAVQPGVLAALGVAPRLGRAFEDATIESDADSILISESLWSSRFARDPAVLGRSIDYAGRGRRIVGVMPAEFRFPDGAANAWLPLHLTAADTAPQNAERFGGLQVVARLTPEGTVAALDAALQGRYGADERIAGMREHMKLVFEVKPLRVALARGKSELVGLLGIAVAVVLLTTLANLANLWLTRALARQRELALASALGASAARAGATVFAEVLVLTLAASLLGLLLAPLSLAALYAAGVLEEGSALVVAIDAPMVALATLLSLGLSLALALPAWWLVRRASGVEALRQGPSVLNDRPALVRARSALIAVQIAAAFALLGTGGLLLRSLEAMLREDTGFDRNGTLLASIDSRVVAERPYGQPPEPADGAAIDNLFARLRAHPQLAVSFANAVPFGGSEAVSTFRPPGAAAGEVSAAKDRSVGPDYFRTLGIPFVAGRGFSATAAGDEVVVDEVFARRYLAGGDPVGQMLGFSDPEGRPHASRRVVGVARTVKHAGLGERDEQGTFYFPVERPGGVPLDLVVRTQMPVGDARALLEREAAAGGLRVSRISTIDALIWRSLRDRTAVLGMIGGFALFGTALAALGLYAVLAFATRRRTAEYGLKLALGADRPRLVREVLREALRIALPGLVLGGLAGAIAVRALGARLYGVGTGDPATWLAVVVAILVLVLLAAALPARRAARVSPTVALRHD